MADAPTWRPLRHLTDKMLADRLRSAAIIRETPNQPTLMLEAARRLEERTTNAK